MALLLFITESFLFMNAFFLVDHKISKMQKNYWQLPLKDIKDSIIAMSDKEDIMKSLINWNFQNERLIVS